MNWFSGMLAGMAAVMLTGCFEVPGQQQLQEPSGLRLVDQCPRQVPVLKQKGDGLPAQFKLTNWNIYKLKRPYALAAIEKSAQTVDLLTYQEAVDDPAFQMGLIQQKYQWQQVAAFRFNGKSAGVLTAARMPALYNCVIRTPEPFFRLPKSALVSLYPLTDSMYPLLVINVHAVNFEPGISVYRRQLTPLFNLIRHYPGPSVFTGDFNSWGNKRSAWLGEMAAKSGLHEAVPVPDVRRLFLGTPLDHLYYSKLNLISVTSQNNPASDHNPLYAELRALPLQK